jgi:lipid-A-disaccharide synthase
MPGSRKQEVDLLAPILLDAAADLRRRDDRLRFVLPVADGHYGDAIRHAIATRGLEPYVTVAVDGREAIRASDLVLLASGTASLEATLLDVPMVIVYRVSALSYLIVRTCIATGLLVAAPVGLPNLLSGRRAVPELLQWRLTARRLADEAFAILTNADREHALRVSLAAARARVSGPDCMKRVVDAIVEVATFARSATLPTVPPPEAHGRSVPRTPTPGGHPSRPAPLTGSIAERR